MATFTNTWFGTQARFSENETNQLINVSAEGGSIFALVSTIFPAGAPVTAIVAGILAVGAGALQICDSAHHRGVLVTILSVGVPWCTGL